MSIDAAKNKPNFYFTKAKNLITERKTEKKNNIQEDNFKRYIYSPKNRDQHAPYLILYIRISTLQSSFAVPYLTETS